MVIAKIMPSPFTEDILYSTLCAKCFTQIVKTDTSRDILKWNQSNYIREIFFPCELPMLPKSKEAGKNNKIFLMKNKDDKSGLLEPKTN